jgi:mannitol/fructose-specific phosphotransferase system IIA component (Ntr-type)
VLLSELLPPERIRIPLAGASKDDLLRELVDVLHATGEVGDPSQVLHAVREREAVLSTGIGNGVAIPHGKSAQVTALAMAAGVTRGPVDFEALDGRPVSLFFLLVGPESAAGDHVKALSRIARLVRSDAVRGRLAGAASPAEFHAILAEAEQS